MSDSPDRELIKIENLRAEIEEVYRANEALAVERDDVLKANERLAGDYDTLTGQLETQQQEATGVLSELARANEKFKTKRFELDSAVAQVDVLREGQSRLETEAATLQIELQDSVRVNEELDIKCRALESDCANLDKLRVSESGLRSKVIELETELASARSELTIAQSVLVATRQRNETLTVEREALASSLDSHQQSAAEKKELVAELMRARDELTSHLATHVQDVQRANARVAELASAVATHRKAAAEFEQIRSQQQTQSEHLESEKARLLSHIDAAQHSEVLLRNELASSRSAVDVQKRTAVKAASAKLKLVGELERRVGQLNKSESAFSEAQGILSRILSQVEQEGSKAAREREGLRTRLRTLTAQFQEAESNLQQQAAEIARLRESESMLRSSLEQERESAKCREAELANAENGIVDLQQKNNHQAERIAELTCQQDQITAAQAATITKSTASESPARTKPSPAKKSTRRRDDFGRISGIGPKIQAILADKRITTFNKLAGTKVTRLENILEAAGPSFRRYDPSTWPDQAKLAAQQRWYELTLLQKQIERRK